MLYSNFESKNPNNFTILDGLKLLCEPGEIYELRCPKTAHDGVVSGYFNDLTTLAYHADSWSGIAPSVYITLNPVKPQLFGRAANSIKRRAKETTADDQIAHRRRLLLDFDPVRAAGISSTDQEHAAALVRTQECMNWLATQGFPEPLLADSGNGGHLIYGIDLPNDAPSSLLVENFIKAISRQFSESQVHVDVSVFNSGRITKIYGTMACKGDNLPDRPHRLSKILKAPESLLPVPQALLSALGAVSSPSISIPETEKLDLKAVKTEFLRLSGTNKGTDAAAWVEKFLARHEIGIRYKKQGNGKWLKRWILERCPFCNSQDTAAAITISNEGKIGFRCQHNRCTEPRKRWADFRGHFEPDYKKPEKQAKESIADVLVRLANEQKRNPEKRTNRAELCLKYALEYLSSVFSVYYNGCLYSYRDNCYRLEQEPDVKVLQWFQDQQVPVTTSTVNNVVAHIKARSLIDALDYPELPFFKNAQGDARNVIPFQNGLLDIKKYCEGKVELAPHSPSFVSFYVLPFGFDPQAACPQWMAFLNQVFEGDDSRIRLLQEWFGYALTADVSLQKFMVFIGLPRSGKGTTSGVLMRLMGNENVTGFNLHRILSNFSFAILRTKQLAVIGEVELSGTKEKTRILETFKSMVGNDSQIIERKGVDAKESCVLPTRYLISCNQMPHLHDTSGALEARMLVLNFNKSFAGNEDPHLLEKLSQELSGIAIWALEGLRRLKKDGWTLPKKSLEEKTLFRKESSPPLEFLQECGEVWHGWVNPMLPNVTVAQEQNFEMCSVLKDDLAKAFWEWSEEKGLDIAFPWFCRDLRSILPEFGKHEMRLTNKVTGKRVRRIPGIRLKDRRKLA